MEERGLYTRTGDASICVVEGASQYVSCAMPILANSDIIGCVAGDDTIIIVTMDNATAVTVSEKLRNILLL